MSKITIKTAGKSEDQIKKEVAEALAAEAKNVYADDPKKREKNAHLIAQLEAITPDQLEIVKPNVTQTTNMAVTITRFYRQQFRDGSLGREMMQEPKHFTTKELLFNYIFRIHGMDSWHRRVCQPIRSKLDNYVTYDNEIISYSLQKDIKDRYDAFYREANATSLYNYPEVTSRIELSNLRILEEEEGNVAFVQNSLIWNLKSKDGVPLKRHLHSFGFYGDIEIFPQLAIDDRYAYDEHGNSPRYKGKIKPNAGEKILESLRDAGEFLLDLIKSFLGF